MTILAYILSVLALLMSLLFLIRLQFPRGFYVMPFKNIAGALSPIWAVVGIVGAALGWAYSASWAVPIGLVGAGMMIAYLLLVKRNHKSFDRAFGADWEDQISPDQKTKMVKRRWSPFLKMNSTAALSWERDITYWMVPDTKRRLLCDIWQPGNGDVSGLAFIFLHGGAWYYMDKDMFTRPFFHHLVTQGHTVMDVAYRLCPEVDIFSMIGDVEHAVAWMKSNADRYGVNPDKIVVGGGSAGGHLALMAAYASGHPELTPEDLYNTDLSVCGVISYYGPSDLLALYQHTNQARMSNLPPVDIGPDTTISQRPDDWRMDTLLGGWPQTSHDAYRLASPISHVHPNCPPTLLIQGNQDLITPVDATRKLYTKLVDAGIPAINVIFPWTEHAFDIFFPQISPPAQSALYDVDRFLALLANKA